MQILHKLHWLGEVFIQYVQFTKVTLLWIFFNMTDYRHRDRDRDRRRDRDSERRRDRDSERGSRSSRSERSDWERTPRAEDEPGTPRISRGNCMQ